MVFSSLLFLFGFLPVFLLVYALAPGRQRNLVALVGSYAFYAWGAPQLAWILLASTLFDFAVARAMGPVRGDSAGERAIARRSPRRRAALGLSVAVNLGVLAWFKYANFFVAELNDALASLGLGTLAWTAVALPIGISFYTFQKLSYVGDVYAGRSPPAERFVDFGLYVALFPQLIAGPIVRYHDIADQIRSRSHSAEAAADGVFRFARGLGKKVLIADALGQVADPVFALPPSALPPSYAWLGLLAFTFQIYFDFSAYSDMAIGLARMLGFRILENFRMPYVSESITEFWRRWHISLSNWMRDYLYVPLGGNRVSRRRTLVNLWTVFLVSGLWHGAAWTFVLWGAYHGLFLTLERVVPAYARRVVPRALKLPLTFGVVMIGWVLFRAESLSGALAYASRLAAPGGEAALPLEIPVWGDLLSHRAAAALWLAGALAFAPAVPGFDRALTWWESVEAQPPWRLAKLAFAAAVGALSVLGLVNSGFQPFIYFRF